jgi:hypothetical protein
MWSSLRKALLFLVVAVESPLMGAGTRFAKEFTPRRSE